MEIVARIHATNSVAGGSKFAIASAGGGATGATALLSTPGASHTVLEATTPYAKEALLSFVGDRAVEKFSSHLAADVLAAAALHRAKCHLTAKTDGILNLPSVGSPVGIGCAAALATDPPRRGGDVIHVTAMSDCKALAWSLNLGKGGALGRAQQEGVAGALVVAATAAMSGMRLSREELLAFLSLSFSDSSEGHNSGVAEAVGKLAQTEIPLPDPLSRLLTSAASQNDCITGGERKSPLPNSHDAEDRRKKQSDTAAAAAAHASSSTERAQTELGLDPVSHVLFVPALEAAASSSNSAAAYEGLYAVPNAPLSVRSSRLLIVPGSFNPFHSGHERMAQAAMEVASSLDSDSEQSSQNGSREGVSATANSNNTSDTPAMGSWKAVFELSATNVDKPPLSSDVILSRARQIVTPSAAADDDASGTGISGRPWPVVVTDAPRFIDKARLFPGCGFVLGYDTAKRLVDPKYYAPPRTAAAASASISKAHAPDSCTTSDGGAAAGTSNSEGSGSPDAEALSSQDAMLEALLALKLQGTTFYVAGRLASGSGSGGEPVFLTLRDLLPSIPPLLRPMFIEIPEASFRVDVSSTQLRAQTAEAAMKAKETR